MGQGRCKEGLDPLFNLSWEGLSVCLSHVRPVRGLSLGRSKEGVRSGIKFSTHILPGTSLSFSVGSTIPSRCNHPCW